MVTLHARDSIGTQHYSPLRHFKVTGRVLVHNGYSAIFIRTRHTEGHWLLSVLLHVGYLSRRAACNL
jgi:hypothetical protein